VLVDVVLAALHPPTPRTAVCHTGTAYRYDSAIHVIQIHTARPVGLAVCTVSSASAATAGRSWTCCMWLDMVQKVAVEALSSIAPQLVSS